MMEGVAASEWDGSSSTSSSSYSLTGSTSTLYSSAKISMYHYDNADKTAEDLLNCYGTTYSVVDGAVVAVFDQEVSSDPESEEKGARGFDDDDDEGREKEEPIEERDEGEEKGKEKKTELEEMNREREKKKERKRKREKERNVKDLMKKPEEEKAAGAEEDSNSPVDDRDIGTLPDSVWNKHFQV